MAYDVELAERVRERLGVDPSVTEKRMFGGLAFLVDGQMAVAVSSQDGLMVRVPREETDEVRALPHVGAMVMKDRPVQGWVLVAPDGCASDADLDEWVERGVETVRGL